MLSLLFCRQRGRWNERRHIAGPKPKLRGVGFPQVLRRHGSEQILGNRGRVGRSWLAVSRLRWERLRSVRSSINGFHPAEQRRYLCFVVVFPIFCVSALLSSFSVTTHSAWVRTRFSTSRSLDFTLSCQQPNLLKFVPLMMPFEPSVGAYSVPLSAVFRRESSRLEPFELDESRSCRND